MNGTYVIKEGRYNITYHGGTLRDTWNHHNPRLLTALTGELWISAVSDLDVLHLLKVVDSDGKIQLGDEVGHMTAMQKDHRKSIDALPDAVISSALAMDLLVFIENYKYIPPDKDDSDLFDPEDENWSEDDERDASAEEVLMYFLKERITSLIEGA